MKNINYRITFYDYWSTSSGLAGGALADSLCIKNPDGLPYVPGKTIKGLLREAIELFREWGDTRFTDEFEIAVFGESETSILPESEKKRKEAISFFTDVTLDYETVKGILEANLKASLFEYISATAIDEEGIAKHGSLRRIEFVVPCELFGTIYHVKEEHEALLIHCMNFVKRIGYNRQRGYGRCKLSIF